jgi:hypothetical protein
LIFSFEKIRSTWLRREELGILTDGILINMEVSGNSKKWENVFGLVFSEYRQIHREFLIVDNRLDFEGINRLMRPMNVPI